MTCDQAAVEKRPVINISVNSGFFMSVLPDVIRYVPIGKAILHGHASFIWDRH